MKGGGWDGRGGGDIAAGAGGEARLAWPQEHTAATLRHTRSATASVRLCCRFETAVKLLLRERMG